MSTIVPEPQSAVVKGSKFKITSTTKVVLGSGNSSEQFIAQQLNDELVLKEEKSLKVTDERSVRRLSSNYIFVGKPTTEYGKKLLSERKGRLTPEMKAEGYFLDVDSKGIVIVAESDKGLFYGMMSLLQMMKKEKRSVTVSGVTIRDFPLQKIRGITDDISRGQISTMENFKKIIRFCARYKMNVYAPYIEDVFTFKKHPEIGRGRGALTPAECRELDVYAKKYFVEVIPTVETLGHWENILLHPDYVKFGEFPGAHTLNVSDDRVHALLDEMIGEVAACFSSPYFNIGADESWDVGLGASKERVAKSGLATVHARHYRMVFDIAEKYGKKPLMYGDIILNHPDILKELSRDVTIVDWHYDAAFEYTSPQTFKRAGFSFIVSPAVRNFTSPFPDYINSIQNIYQLNLDGYKNGSLGILCSNWNDFGGEALRELNYYGYAWAAECAWNPLRAEQARFNKKFLMDFFGTGETDAAQSIYSMLGAPSNQYHWYELWRHPMLPARSNTEGESRLPLIHRMQSIQSTIPFVLELIEKAGAAPARNADHLQYLKFIARLNLWFAKKIEVQEKVKLLLKNSTASKRDNTEEAVGLCKDVVSELLIVRMEFEKVWRTTNKPQGLELLLNRYDRQAAYWNELAGQIEQGSVGFDPVIKSRWIYHPNVSDTISVPKAYFRKTFAFPKDIGTAKLQLLGDTWSKLYVNGKFVGEVYARQSLSLKVESERAKIFDIAPFVVDATTVIAVESQNFQANGSAGTNLYGEIVTTDSATVTITTDDSWFVSDTALNNWNKPEFNAHSWPLAVPKDYPVPVIAPNLATGRTSWFEQ